MYNNICTIIYVQYYMYNNIFYFFLLHNININNVQQYSTMWNKPVVPAKKTNVQYNGMYTQKPMYNQQQGLSMKENVREVSNH